MIELDIPTTGTLSTTTASTILQTASDNQLLAAAEAGISSINSSGIAASALYGLCNQSAWQLALDSSNASTHCVGNHTSNADDISFILPWWRQVLWSILFGGMVIVATGGNLIVVWIVLAHKRMRTVTNYFIVNLSIADAMVSSLNVTFNYIYMLDNDWPFGELYCKISQFIATLSICASVFTLMAISIDRYVAIIKPLQPRMGKRSTLTVAATIWICSIILSCPMLLFFTTDQISSKDGIRTVCYSEWPDGSTNHSHQEYIYNILFMILTYFLPIISMIVTYSIVGLELWGSKAIGEYTPRQVENVKSKRRVVKMMIVVVVIFAVCWLPFQIYFIVTSCYPDITEMPFIQEVFLAIYWLAMSNSMYNPIIYCWMNSRFRRGFKQFFRWCPFVHIGAETLNRRDNMTSRYSCSGSPDHHRIIRNDTERSFLYTCPGSPKSRRISHCGAVRNSALACQRDPGRHSTPVGGSCGSAHLGNNLANSYHQRHSGHVNAKANANANTNANTNTNGHELSALCPLNSSKDYMKVATRNNTLQLRQKWTPPAAAADPQDNGTAAATATASTTTTTTTAATTASGAAATTGPSGNASTVVTGLMPHRVTALS